MKQFVNKIIQLVAIAAIIYVLVFASIIAWRLFRRNTAEALAETAPEMLLEQLRDFKQEYDFQPTCEAIRYNIFRTIGYRKRVPESCKI